MTTKSKWFVVATEGATTDGREISREWLTQIEEKLRPENNYGARINLSISAGVGLRKMTRILTAMAMC